MANDFYAQVTVREKGSPGFPISESGSKFIVRIPFDFAVSLCEPQKPTHNHVKMFQTFADAAHRAKGGTGAMNKIESVNAADVLPATVRPSDLGDPDWSNESGVEAWILPLSARPNDGTRGG